MDSLVNWFKDLFNKKKDKPLIENKEERYINIVDVVTFEIIHINPNVYLSHRAARICIGKGIDDDYNKRMQHLENIIGVNKHESVAEHSNVIVLFKLHKNHLNDIDMSDYLEFMSNIKFCNSIVHDSPTIIYILLGGSARAFMHLIRETKTTNKLLPLIKRVVYNGFEKCFLKSLIDDNLLEEEYCTYLPEGVISLVHSNVTQTLDKYENTDVENFDADCSYITDPVEIESEHVDVVYMSPINDIYDKIKKYGFTLHDVYKVATISFVFHDISRSCSHQLVRHRNAISQESQRYVKQIDTFVNPIELNRQERYSDKRFREVLEKTASIINRGFSEYNWLLNHKVNKEDARAFLPTNVTTKLMMTMTYVNYAYFLNLRLDKAAQKEIRNIAEETVDLVLDHSKMNDFIEYCITPVGLKKTVVAENVIVDEIIEEEYKPTNMVNTEESAIELLKQQERYKQMEEN